MSEEVFVDGKLPTIPDPKLLNELHQPELQEYEEELLALIRLCEETTDSDVKAKFETHINDIITKKERLEQLTRQERPMGCSIRRLPSELLGLVMVCHVHDNGQSPWVLLAVCKSWRYLGSETPRIWSRIHVISTPTPLYIGPPFHPAASCQPAGGVLCKNEES